MMFVKPTKIDVVRKAAAEANGNDTSLFTVSLADIRRDTVFQPREGLDDDNLSKLKGLFKAGTKVDPIVIAFLPDEAVPVIVDGHHRHRALESMGRDTVDAVAATMTRDQAERRAFETNDRHGLPLNRRERRGQLGLIIRRGDHLVRGGYDKRGQGIGIKHKSYAELAEIMGVSKSTVRNWMKADFPDIYRKMGGFEDAQGEGGLQPKPKEFAKEVESVRLALSALRKAFDAAPDHSAREEMIGLTESMLKTIRAQHEIDDMGSLYWNPPTGPDDESTF